MSEYFKTTKEGYRWIELAIDRTSLPAFSVYWHDEDQAIGVSAWLPFIGHFYLSLMLIGLISWRPIKADRTTGFAFHRENGPISDLWFHWDLIAGYSDDTPEWRNGCVNLKELVCGYPKRVRYTINEAGVSVRIGDYCENFVVKREVVNVQYKRFNRFVDHHFYGVNLDPIIPDGSGGCRVSGDMFKGLNMTNHDQIETRHLLKRCINIMLDRRIEIHTSDTE